MPVIAEISIKDPVTTGSPKNALTGREVHDLVIKRVRQWRSDAVLSELGTIVPLDPSGKSTGWSLKFWSPLTKGWLSAMYMDGKTSGGPAAHVVPEAVVIPPNTILDTKKLYDIAETEGEASQYTSKGYRPIAAIVLQRSDKPRLVWYFNYSGGDGGVVYTVIMDAISGEVTHKLD